MLGPSERRGSARAERDDRVADLHRDGGEGRLGGEHPEPAAAVGLGVPIAQGAFFEARVTHQWFHQLPEDSALASRSWVVTGGLSFDIP